VAVTSPLASVSMAGGRSATSSVLTSAERLGETGAGELAPIVVATLLVVPTAKFIAVLAMIVSLRRGRIPLWTKSLFRTLPHLTRWAMVEVYVLGALIALVRLRPWMHVEFGPALFALGGVAVCLLGIDKTLDKRALWNAVPWRRAPGGRSSQALSACSGCGLVSSTLVGARCPRCNSLSTPRKKRSIDRTWALVVAAALLAIPANVLPIMSISKFGRGGPSTIVGGTEELLNRGFVGLAIVVFVASVLVPLFKLVALSGLAASTTRASTSLLSVRTRLFRFVSVIGRWSMIDVFATMTLVALARFGWLGSVLPEAGATAFCAVVVLTMLAAEAFDPRLMWDAAGMNGERRSTEELARV
jgi:paraquat-inducible protein A